MITNIDVTFELGKGRLTVILNKNGVQLHKQEIKETGKITFNDTQVGDGISIDGICTGTAKVAIDSKTDPTTPVVYQAGEIFDVFDITNS